ncbi:hypothetical protein GCM10027049_02890 [Mucilaginibacter puniceus]
MRSLFVNQNVYKTKDTLALKEVYDYEKHGVIHNDEVYLLDPGYSRSESSFLRYTVVKDGEKQVIKIPGLVSLIKDKIKVKGKDSLITRIVYLDTSNHELKDNAKPSYFQFINPTKDEPVTKQYLATEHITALPITIPIKFRPNVPSNRQPFSLNASVSYAFGYKIRVNNNPYKENFIRILPFSLGLGTEMYLHKDSVSNDKYKGETNIALSMASGITYEASNRFNIGIFVGIDKMFNDKKNWIYQNKAWFGLGFGYKFGGGAAKEKEEE